MPRKKKTARRMAPDDKRLKNLKPAKPGEVRNPLGKNGSDWLSAFRDFFAEQATEKLPKGSPRREPGDTRHRLAMKALFMRIMRGSDQGQKLALEQLQGRARQSVEMTGPGGTPLVPGSMVTVYMPSNGRENENPDDEIDEPEAPGADASSD